MKKIIVLVIIAVGCYFGYDMFRKTQVVPTFEGTPEREQRIMEAIAMALG